MPDDDPPVSLSPKGPRLQFELYPVVRDYVSMRCFGEPVDVDEDALRSHLKRPEMQERIVAYLTLAVTRLTIERRAIEFDKADFRLSETKPFSWRRNLPPLEATKTVFNYVATYNDYERRFADFLDSAPDVARFAALGTTEQGASGTQFRVDRVTDATGQIWRYARINQRDFDVQEGDTLAKLINGR